LKAAKPPRKTAALLGLGLDDDGGETRVTRGHNFLLWGGSKNTHACMQETATKINERLDKKGKRLEDVSVRELGDICREVTESIGGRPEPGTPDHRDAN
jgi:hypothetical protein